MAETDKSSTVQTGITQAFGQAAPAADDRQTQKTNLLSFSDGGVFLSLKLVSRFDERTNTRQAPVPRITYSVGGTFLELPMSGTWWKAYADFVAKMADALEGTNVSNARIEDDVAYAKQMMARYKARP